MPLGLSRVYDAVPSLPMTRPRQLNLPDSAILATGADARRFAPSAERNAASVLAELQRVAPERGRVLELASGTGQHAACFAAALSGLIWQPTDVSPDALTSIKAWASSADLPNLRAPLLLNAAQPGWAADHQGYDLTLTVNLLHLISTIEAQTVVAGMAGSLTPGGTALIYGPFKREGQLTSAGDRQFDASLRAQDPAIGYKDVAEVIEWGRVAGLTLLQRIDMPANNLMLVLGNAGLR